MKDTLENRMMAAQMGEPMRTIHVEFDESDNCVPCHRHGDGYAILYSLNSAVLSDARKTNGITEGFIDQTGTFYDRAEAYKEALACGQIPETLRECKIEKREGVLYSEDLY